MATIESDVGEDDGTVSRTHHLPEPSATPMLDKWATAAANKSGARS